MPEGKKKTRNEHSSGGAVVSVRNGLPHVALIATRNRTRWGLPKGAVSAGETSEQAAIREVREETGIDAEIVKLLTKANLEQAVEVIRKRVDFYLMRYVGGELTPQLSEVDDVEWVELGEAISRASFESEKKLLESAQMDAGSFS